MKKLLIAILTTSAFFMPLAVAAQVQNNYWILSANILKPIIASWTLQVTNKAADPTGSNGAIYYNTGTGVFRCYAGGAWVNCASAGGGTSDPFTHPALGQSATTSLMLFNGGATSSGGGFTTNNLWATGTSTLATTTTSSLNGVIVVDGVHYAQSGAGIQNALNDCAAAGGGRVYLPTAIYSTTATITFPFDAHCRLLGPKFDKSAGYGGAEIRATGALTSLITASGNFANTNADLTHDNGISYVYLNGNNNVTDVILLTNVDYFTLDYVRISGGINGVNTAYNGVYPPTASSIPGAVMIDHSIISVRDNKGGYNVALNAQSQSWITNSWFDGLATSTMLIASSTQIKVQGDEFDTADTSITFADSNGQGTSGIAINGNKFSPGLTAKICIDNRTNLSNSAYVSFLGNSIANGLPCTLFRQGEVILQPFTSLNNGNISVIPNGTGKTGLGTSSPLSALHIEANNPALSLYDTANPSYTAGLWQIQDISTSLRFFLGLIGVSAGEVFRLDTGATAKGLNIQNTSAGVFTGTNLTTFPISGVSYINNGSNFGIGTTSPGSALSVQGNQFIAGNIVSTSTTASILPYASTTAISATNLVSGNCLQASTGGFLTTTGSACNSGTVTSVTGTYPVISSGGATPAISLAFGTTTANTWVNGQIVAGANIIPLSTTPGQLDIRTTNAEAADLGGSLTLGGYNDSSASAYRVFGAIGGRKSDGSSGVSSGYLEFKTNNAGSVAERMRIDNVGHVGINQTTPGSATFLNVAGRGLFTAGVSDSGDSTAAGTAIGYNTSGGFGFVSAIQTGITTKSLVLNGDGGKVGIGTTTPNGLLQVAGTRPFFTLTDTSAGANLQHWFHASEGGNLYVGTSSDALATSTVSAFAINANGIPTFASLGSGAVSAASGVLSAGTLSVANGGTGAATLSGGQVLYGNGTGAIGSVATGTVSAGSTAITVTAGRSAIGGALAIDCAGASGSQNGCLSSTDWTTFNGKQAALSGGTANLMTYWTSASAIGATSTPAATAWTATSSIATSTFNGNIWVGATSLLPYLQVGSTTVIAGTGQVPGNYLQVVGNNNTTAGIQMGLQNVSPGTSAYTSLYLNNDKADSTVIHFGALFLNSFGYTDTTFGTGLAFGGLMGLQNTEGALVLLSSTSTTNSRFSVFTGGSALANERLRITSTGNVGIASTTPFYMLSVGTTGTTYGTITTTENPVATSTTQVINWLNGNQQLVQMGGAAMGIGFTNASTSGLTMRLVVCNPGGTAGALTWNAPIEWAGGTAPVQTTTANVCDLYSFIVTQATSTNGNSHKIFGASTLNFK